VRVRNHAIGLNFIDTYFRSGLYAPPSLPSGWAPKRPAWSRRWAGRHRIKVGDRVAYAGGPLGAYSEVHTLPEANLVKLPEAISFEQAAAVMLKGLTVQYLLRRPMPCSRAKPSCSTRLPVAWVRWLASGPRRWA
jgi:NADPH2:quinone reductase